MSTSSKQQLIEQISSLNRSARAEFLGEFSEAELQQYFDNLRAVWEDFEKQFAEPAEEFQQQEIERERREPSLLIA